MAGVGAAAVRVERPLEGHALHRIQRRAAANFLVACGVRSASRVRQCIGAASLANEVRDLSGGGVLPAEIEEKWGDFHGKPILLRYIFACKPSDRVPADPARKPADRRASAQRESAVATWSPAAGGSRHR